MENYADTPLIPEHGPRTNITESPLSQTKEELDAVKLAEHLFAKAKRARARIDKDWLEYSRYFVGDQWSQKRPSYRHSEVINVVTSNIRSMMAELTDPQPNVQTIPEDPSDFEFSEILNEMVSSKWDRENFNQIVAEVIVDAGVVGTGIAGVPWVKELCDGIGDYSFESLDPMHCFPDPSATNVNSRTSKFFVVAQPVDVEILREEYPDKKDRIKPDLSDVVTFNSYTDEAREFAFKSPTDNRMMVPESKSLNNQANPDLALKIQCTILSDEVVSKTESITDPQTGSQSTIEKIVKKYPNGRVITIASGYLLADDELPYEDGKIPYARYVNDIIPRSFWGEGELKTQKSPQDIVNKLISYFLDYLIIMGNPMWVMDDESMVDADNITNEPGQVLVKKQGTEVRREQGLSPPPFILDTMQYFIGQIFGKLSGSNEISQGVLTKAQLSGEAISQLTEASQTRVRAKSRNLDAFLNEIGQLQVSRILQYYVLPRIIRVSNNQASSKYFRVSIDRADPKAQRIATYQGWDDNANNGAGGWGPAKQVALKSNLDVRMSTGTSLPLAKAQRDQQAERFFDKGILDAEDLLDTIQYPNKERVLEKWKQRQAAMAQQQAQQPPPKQ